MSFYKINYGNNDENYQMFLYNNAAINLDFFCNQVNNILQDNIKSLLDSNSLNSIATFEWVESCKEKLYDIGYESLNQECFIIDYEVDEEDNIQLIKESLKKTSGIENNKNKTLCEVGIYSEFNPEVSVYSYFYVDSNKIKDFVKILNDFLKQHSELKTNKIETYIESLDYLMKQNDFELINTNNYTIYCDHKEKLSNSWTSILGKELMERINNYNFPQRNIENNLNLDLELPF